tara:strand:- start:28 stop:648 length:621 start_codon:yes stop_codon:yes gene_type:complete
MALVKYNNNSISAITTAGTLATGAMVLIKEQTASSSSTIDFVDGSSDVVLDNTYPIYLFKFINIHPATNNAHFTFQGSTDTGSSYGVNITSSAFSTEHNEADSSTDLSYQTGVDLAQSTSFQRITSSNEYDNDNAAVGFLYLFNPSNTTFVKHFIIRGNTVAQAYTVGTHIAGYFNTTSAIDAIQFKFSSGNIDAGKIKLYGLKDS